MVKKNIYNYNINRFNWFSFIIRNNNLCINVSKLMKKYSINETIFMNI